jgi:threonine dehydrogenase-like Zn-dependent dehydrogenase
MKAVVFTKPNQMETSEVEVPKIGPEEVLLRSKAVGICRSDFDLLKGEYILPLHWPIIPGHEYSGEIVEIGKDVKNYKIGDRVVGECAVGCGSCSLCTSGFANCCNIGDHFGFTIDGAMAEYVKVHSSWLHKIPDNLSYKEGALIEPFTVGYFALSNIGGVGGSDTVLILGAGVIGLSALIASVGNGARTILVDNQQGRLELGKKLGAFETINVSERDLLDSVMELTDGEGAGVVVEAVGVDPLMKKVFNLASYNGRISLTGINFTEKLDVPLHLIQAKGLTVKGNIGSPFVWEKALQFLSNTKPDLSSLCTHEIPIEKAKEAFDIANDPKLSVKVQIIP